MYLVKGGASNQNKRISVRGAGTTAQVNMNTPDNNFLIEIDRLVRPDTNVFCSRQTPKDTMEELCTQQQNFSRVIEST
jgi:hypothetical protein